jgi:5-methylcytosine-specific restriction endonuclease McrA
VSEGRLTEAVRAGVRAQANDRCGYCLSPQRVVLGWMEIEHIIPQARGGSDDKENLWLACRLCNNYKGVQTEALDPVTAAQAPLFNPRTQTWTEHFVWTTDGARVIGQTPPDGQRYSPYN